MHDDGKDDRVSHGICFMHLDAMREKLAHVTLPKEATDVHDDS